MGDTLGEYAFPKDVVSLRLQPLPESAKSISEYLSKVGYAFAADLLAQGFGPSEVETAVRQGNVGTTPWPKNAPLTEFFWLKDEPSADLESLAKKATSLCCGGYSEPIGGDYVTVGVAIDNQARALAGLIYAREMGMIREVSFPGNPRPLYVRTGSFLDTMFSTLEM